MLSLEEIKKNTKWVAKLNSGARYTGTYDELKHLENDDDLDDFDTVCSDGQPKKLRAFWKAYEYALYELKRDDLFIIDDFYREWSKNPSQFEMNLEIRPVIGLLSDILVKYENTYKNFMIINYNKKVIGNHYCKNYKDTLKELDKDFDVIEVTEEDKETVKIIIQCLDEELVDELSYMSNHKAIQNSNYF